MANNESILPSFARFSPLKLPDFDSRPTVQISAVKKQATVKKKGSVICPICDASFMHVSSKNRHIKTIHEGQPREPRMKSNTVATAKPNRNNLVDVNPIELKKGKLALRMPNSNTDLVDNPIVRARNIMTRLIHRYESKSKASESPRNNPIIFRQNNSLISNITASQNANAIEQEVIRVSDDDDDDIIIIEKKRPTAFVAKDLEDLSQPGTSRPLPSCILVEDSVFPQQQEPICIINEKDVDDTPVNDKNWKIQEAKKIVMINEDNSGVGDLITKNLFERPAEYRVIYDKYISRRGFSEFKGIDFLGREVAIKFGRLDGSGMQTLIDEIATLNTLKIVPNCIKLINCAPNILIMSPWCPYDLQMLTINLLPLNEDYRAVLLISRVVECLSVVRENFNMILPILEPHHVLIDQTLVDSFVDLSTGLIMATKDVERQLVSSIKMLLVYILTGRHVTVRANQFSPIVNRTLDSFGSTLLEARDTLLAALKDLEQ